VNSKYLSLILAATLLGGPAIAQNRTPQLSDQTVERPMVGLTATLPLGSSLSSYQMAGRGVSSIQLPGVAALVNLSDRRLAEPRTLADVADSIIRDSLASVSSVRVDPENPTGRRPVLETAKGKLLSRERREIRGWPAEVFFLHLAGGSGEDQARGYAVFMPTSTSVAIYEMQSTFGDLERARPYFNLLVDSTRIVDPEAAEAARALGVEAGISFFSGLNPSDYERVIRDLGEEWRYERFYKPAASGDDREATELGYRRTRYALGSRGDLRTREERRGSRPEDRQKGFLVIQEARLLHEGQIVDVAAGFFMTPDRRHEAWTIRQTIRPTVGGSRAASSTVVETAVRERSDLLVTRSSGGSPGTSITPGIEGRGYVSRAEVYLMPYLLMHGEMTDPIRAYAFNPSADRVTLREDHLRPREGGGYEYESRPSEGSPGQTTLFDDRGRLVRSDLPGDQAWEPIALKRLYDLWRSKGLPLE
jgi:hypothetical protein